MAFGVFLTSTLTGASPKQLAYWRRRTPAHEPLLVPANKQSGHYIYSWSDVVALRSIVFLRQERSLHRIRKAVATLRAIESDKWRHLAEYKLFLTGESIVVVTPEGEILDLDKAPGTVMEEVLMRDVLEPFESASGRMVPALREPKPNLRVDPSVLGGYPVVRATRVPFDFVSELAEDGLKAGEIMEMYPSVSEAAIKDAVDFAREVADVAA